MCPSTTSKSILWKFAKQPELRPVKYSHALERIPDRYPHQLGSGLFWSGWIGGGNRFVHGIADDLLPYAVATSA